MQHTVKLSKLVHVHSKEEGKGYSLSLQKTICLPFVPIQGMSLGLLPDSEFCDNEEQIKRVMYLTNKNVFLVELGDFRFDGGISYFEGMCKDGWRLDFLNLVDLESCKHTAGEDFPYIVEVGDEFCCLDENEVRILEIEGTPFKIHAKV